MRRALLLVAALGPLAPACSEAADAHPIEDASVEARADAAARGDDALIVPEVLDVRALAGGNGVLSLIALTLQKGPRGVELLAALRNDGDRPACDAALSVELFDKSEQSLAAGIGGLLTQHFYHTSDGSDAIAACVGPGDVTMVALTDLPPELAIEDVGYVVYRCPYFALEVAPAAGLSIRGVKSATTREGTTYAVTLFNELDVSVRNPSITVFALNSVGRPLGITTTRATLELASGGSWAFETDAESAPGTLYIAFPAGEISRPVR